MQLPHVASQEPLRSHERPWNPRSAKIPPSSRKRKRDNTDLKGKEVIDLTADPSPGKAGRQGDEERRLKRWRARPPQAYHVVRERALTQRMFVLDRKRNYDGSDHPTEELTLAGSTGNIYTIIIDQVPRCNCPHACKGNQCKHIIYVLARVLRAPSHLQYQAALTRSELREIFDGAPPLPSEHGADASNDGNRKPVEGDCPICCEDFEPLASGEEIVYCREGCGNNVHKLCFDQWAATKRSSMEAATCPFCRASWRADADALKNVALLGQVNAEGYVNVGESLGLSRHRDYSSYNEFWMRSQSVNDFRHRARTRLSRRQY